MLDNLISVIVPVYNIEQWLPRCIDSIRSQTYQNLDIIIVDDGSKDNSLQIAQEYASIDHRITVIHKENGGVTSARLKGISEAKGEWVGFVDGDDTIAPDMYEHLLNNALKEKADISHCGYQLVFADGRISYFNQSGIFKIQDNAMGIKDLLEGAIVGSGLVTKLFKKELFMDLEKQMDTSIKYNEDLLMNFYLFSHAKKAVLEDICLYNYIVRQGSASRCGLTKEFIFEPLYVQDIILSNCKPENKRDALSSRLRGCINTYCMLSRSYSLQFNENKKKIRAMIIEQKSAIHLLPVRSRILGEMICLFPWIFYFIYPIYCNFFQNNRYE